MTLIKKAGTGLAAGAVGLSAAGTLSTPALAKGKRKWICVSAFGKAGLLGQALAEFAKYVDTASDGR